MENILYNINNFIKGGPGSGRYPAGSGGKNEDAAPNEKEEESVLDYVGTGYENINNYNRHGRDAVDYAEIEDIKNKTEQMDNLIQKQKEENYTVFRGADSAVLSEIMEKNGLNEESSIKEMQEVLKGSVIQDDAFLSTSISEDIAYNFTKGEGSVIFKLQANNKKAFNVDKFLEVGRPEEEVIFQRKSKIKINSIEKDGKLFFIEGEIL